MSDEYETDGEVEYEDKPIGVGRFLELVVIGIVSSIVVLQLIWALSDN